MLNENIKRLRKSKGLSQEELAIKMNVVRQTISKWENGLSVPDSSMLILLADELDTTVSELLGDTVAEPVADDLKTISEKLEVINLQLAKKPIECLEYVILNELTHLLIDNHGEDFVSYMDAKMPFWRETRKKLNDSIMDYMDSNADIESRE